MSINGISHFEACRSW